MKIMIEPEITFDRFSASDVIATSSDIPPVTVPMTNGGFNSDTGYISAFGFGDPTAKDPMNNGGNNSSSGYNTAFDFNDPLQ